MILLFTLMIILLIKAIILFREKLVRLAKIYQSLFFSLIDVSLIMLNKL